MTTYRRKARGWYNSTYATVTSCPAATASNARTTSVRPLYDTTPFGRQLSRTQCASKTSRAQCVHAYTCMHICTHICIYIYIYIHICICTLIQHHSVWAAAVTDPMSQQNVTSSTCKRIYMHAYICTYKYIYLYICMYLYCYIIPLRLGGSCNGPNEWLKCHELNVYMHIYACIYIHTYIYIYIWIYVCICTAI